GQLEVFGGIYVISAQPIAFTVPIYTYMDKSNPQLMLFECTLDLKKNQARDTTFIIASIAGLGLALLALSRLFARYLTGPTLLTVTIRNLDYVMQAAKDPYVRVNPDDRIERFNQAF